MAHTCILKQSCRILQLLLVGSLFVATINSVNATECGTVNLYREAVLGGEEVVKYEWPFIAALYNSRTFKYFCGGTIISRKHVLTAAHCIQTKGKRLPLTPDNITVRLGAFNLTDRNEKDAVNRNVTQIYVHPDWKFNDEKYDADVAILVLNESLTFSDHIRPVCMSPADFLIDGLSGTVVGWGKTENGTAEGIPRKIEVNALNDTYCYQTDDGIARFASERSFCGEGSGTPNEGDSGGGFFAVAGSGWVQFGTVSFIRPKETGTNLKIAMYMKLTSLSGWIADKVEESGDTIKLSKTTTDLNCTYGYSKKGAYSCVLFDLSIRQENFEVEKFNGLHEFNKTNDDVELIAFETGVMVSPPRNFGNIFRNLNTIQIVNTRRIYRSHFQNLERLEEILMFDCSIAEFDENALWDLPNLQIFQLQNCKLKFLHSHTFRRNAKLKMVNFDTNLLKSLSPNLFKNNLLLESVSFVGNSIETIDDNIFETNANLSVVFLRGNRITHLSRNLFQNNPELRFIDLSNNRIKTIDEGCFTASSKLSYISLTRNELEFLPAQLLHGMDSLEYIFLYENVLNSIDEFFFSTNARIRVVGLEFNQLNPIPAKLFRNNSELRTVGLGSNSIDTIDEIFFEKNALLQGVSLDFNHLVNLPENLFRHNSMLEVVRVRNNFLEKIYERTFESNTRIREVYFDGNYLTSLPGKLFQNNFSLEIVHLESNSLEAIDENTFHMNSKLLEVYLQSNMLNQLPERLFLNNPLLKIVDLSSNLFKTLNENVFSGNYNLEKFVLNTGGLESLPRNLFQGNTRLKYIDLRGNSIKLIKTNFTALKQVKFIDLSGNDCVDSVFYNIMDDTNELTNDSRWSRGTRNLTELQYIVDIACF